jgi:oligopeptide transport system permease protein
MIRYIVRRLLEFIPVLFVIVTMTFFMVRLAPGGPFADERAVSDEALAQIRAHYDLDGSIWRQYGEYLWNLVQGDLGPSLKRPSYSVAEWLGMKLPISLELGFYGLLVAVGLGLPAGILAAWRPNTWTDYVPMGFAMAGICIPNFVLGPLLVLVFAIWLDWLPVALWEQPAGKILPAITLGAIYAAYIARLARASLLDVLNQDFIRTARAKGCGERRVVLRHGLRGAMQPVVAFLGPASAGLVAGSFVVENIFRVPGLGTEFVNAALNRDYTMIMGTVLLFAAMIMLFNLLVDVVQAWLDPRLRHV